MSLLSTVEQAIKSCKVEQARINDSIQMYRDLLRDLTSQPKAVSEESELADYSPEDSDTSPGEKEEIELLERALEKALRVRTSTEAPKKDRNKQAAFQEAAPSDVTTSSVISKECQPTVKSTSKSSSLDRRSLKKAALGSRPLTSYNPGQSKTTNKTITQNRPSSSVRVMHYEATSASGSSDSVSAFLSKNKTSRSNVLSSNSQAKAASVSKPSSNNRQTDESGVCSTVQQNGIPCEWKSLRCKQNRLWDKVVVLQNKSVPGRNHFVERLRASFPKDWPCGSPDQTRTLVYRLIHQGHEPTQPFQTREDLARTTPERAPKQGGRKGNRESSQMTATEIQSFANQLKQAPLQHKYAAKSSVREKFPVISKPPSDDVDMCIQTLIQEWKAWDRWRPEGACLCPSGANGVCGRGIIAHLPLTINYTTETELQELEKLRTRVAQLQQEIHLEQALLDTLSPQLSTIAPGPRCPNPSVLRDVYSLLGEGGERFPAIVLDSEPD